MAIPTTAKKAAESIDPSDVTDFIVNMIPLLEIGEEFASMVIEVYPESAALGFTILTAGGYAPVELSNGRVQIFVTVELENQEDAIYASGKAMGIKVSTVTDSVPPRKHQRSATIQVGQR